MRRLTAPALLFILSFGCGGQVESSTTGDTQPGTGGDGGTGPAAGGAAGSTGTGGAVVEPAPLCPMDGLVTSDVAGSTPLGDFSLPYAWTGHLAGECGGLVLALSAAPSFSSQPEPPVLVFSDVGYDPMSGYVGEGEVQATLSLPDSSVSTTAWVKLTHVDPMPDGPLPDGAEYPRTEGEIKASGDGWSLAGSFKARYCEHMDVYCP